MLPTDCDMAFKEWAAVCAALESGRQTIILRKGGIHEGRDQFRVAHSQFWLFPTNFHQAAEALTADAAEHVATAAARRPPTGVVPLRSLAVVEAVRELTDEADALALAGLHVWSESTVRQRFHYRQAGLFMLVVRVYRRDEPIELSESPDFAGCKSWVPLPAPLSTAGLTPVLDDAAFRAQCKNT